MVRFSVTPEVNAASTILIVVTVLLTFLALQVPGLQSALPPVTATDAAIGSR